MSMLVMCNIEYLKKGKFYWVKFIVCNAMLGIYVKYMMLLVVLKTLRNTFPNNVSLVIMESYLRMLRVFIVTMISNKLKNLLFLRVLMKLLLWLKSMILLSTNLKIPTYLNIAMKTRLIMPMWRTLLRKWPFLWKKIMICMNL